jgi:hypothetical protein
MLWKTRARDTLIRQAVRHFAEGVVLANDNPKVRIWIADCGRWIFLHGLAPSEVLGMQWARVVLDHLVAEGEFLYGDEYMDTVIMLSRADRQCMWDVRKETASASPAVVRYQEEVDARKKAQGLK